MEGIMTSIFSWLEGGEITPNSIEHPSNTADPRTLRRRTRREVDDGTRRLDGAVVASAGKEAGGHTGGEDRAMEGRPASRPTWGRIGLIEICRRLAFRRLTSTPPMECRWARPRSTQASTTSRKPTAMSAMPPGRVVGPGRRSQTAMMPAGNFNAPGRPGRSRGHKREHIQAPILGRSKRVQG